MKPLDYFIAVVAVWYLWLGFGAIINTNAAVIQAYHEKFWAIVGRRFFISIVAFGILLWRLYG